MELFYFFNDVPVLQKLKTLATKTLIDIFVKQNLLVIKQNGSGNISKVEMSN